MALRGTQGRESGECGSWCADVAGRRRGRPHATRQQQRVLPGHDITWFDWSTVDHDVLSFTTGLIGLRHRHPVFRRRRFLTGRAAADLRWFTVSGTEMTDQNWADPLRDYIARGRLGAKSGQGFYSDYHSDTEEQPR